MPCCSGHRQKESSNYHLLLRPSTVHRVPEYKLQCQTCTWTIMTMPIRIWQSILTLVFVFVNAVAANHHIIVTVPPAVTWQICAIVLTRIQDTPKPPRIWKKCIFRGRNTSVSFLRPSVSFQYLICTIQYKYNTKQQNIISSIINHIIMI